MAQAGQPRRWKLDALRGFSLLSMLGYHGMYDWVYVFGHTSWYSITNPACHLWQQSICWVFILLSGASFHLARRPWKNGLITFGCGMVLTAVTLLVMPEEKILFGVLHFLGLAALLFWLADGLLKRLPAGVGLVGAAVAFFLTNQLPFGYLGFEGLKLCALPAALYQPNWFWLGFQRIGVFYSADYFPLLPWLFLYGCGYFGWRLWAAGYVGPGSRPAPAALRPLCWIGRHTLLLYMLHQPALMAALWLLNRAAG